MTQLIRDFDLKTVSADDIRSFTIESSFTTKNADNTDDMTDVDSDENDKKVHGFGFWFDVVFAGSGTKPNKIQLIDQNFT